MHQILVLNKEAAVPGAKGAETLIQRCPADSVRTNSECRLRQKRAKMRQSLAAFEEALTLRGLRIRSRGTHNMRRLFQTPKAHKVARSDGCQWEAGRRTLPVGTGCSWLSACGPGALGGGSNKTLAPDGVFAMQGCNVFMNSKMIQSTNTLEPHSRCGLAAHSVTRVPRVLRTSTRCRRHLSGCT